MRTPRKEHVCAVAEWDVHGQHAGPRNFSVEDTTQRFEGVLRVRVCKEVRAYLGSVSDVIRLQHRDGDDRGTGRDKRGYEAQLSGARVSAQIARTHYDEVDLLCECRCTRDGRRIW